MMPIIKLFVFDFVPGDPDSRHSGPPLNKRAPRVEVQGAK